MIAAQKRSALMWTARSSARQVPRASIVLLACLTAILLPGGVARAESAWWHLTTGTRPTYLHAGPAKPMVPEVQEIFTEPGTIDGHAEQTKFLLKINSPFVQSVDKGVAVEEFATEPLAKETGVKPLSAANLQKTLEGPSPLYGPGEVTVEEVTTDRSGKPLEAGDRRFLVTTGFPRSIHYYLKGQATSPSKVTVAEVTRYKEELPDGEVYVYAENVGDESLSGEGSPVTLTDALPPGLRAVSIEGTQPGFRGFLSRTNLKCAIEAAGTRGTCTAAKKPPEPPGFEGGSEYELVAPFGRLEMRIGVMVEGAVSGEQNEASVSGGESFVCENVGKGVYQDSGCGRQTALATFPHEGQFERVATGAVAPASVKGSLTISAEAVPFGVDSYELTNEEEGGAPTTQAGAHPFQQTTTITLNQTFDREPPGIEVEKVNSLPAALAKDVHFRWPAGLIGNPTVFPRCTDAQFFTFVPPAYNACPADSAVGVVTVVVNEPTFVGFLEITEPLFNLTPRPGEPARFGFFIEIAKAPVLIDTSIRTGGDYGVTVSVNNISQVAAFLSAEVTVWGVPGDPRHNSERGWNCLEDIQGHPRETCTPGTEVRPAPFLSMPTFCQVPLSTSVEADSWTAPGALQSFAGLFGPEVALEGCNRLPFSAEIKAAPDGQRASTPTGLNVDVHVPQEEDLNAVGLASSNIKNIKVVLPKGVGLNPSAADGLQACSEGEIGYLPAQSSPPSELHFTPDFPSCPDASKIATAKIKTPLLPDPLEGEVYLAAPAPRGEAGQNPFDSLVAMYLVAYDPVSGSLVKLAGRVTLNQVNGQIEATFEDTPQLAFEDAELHFFGGERAPLATPDRCGSYTTEAQFTPWSGNPPISSSTTFQITEGPNGTPCPASALPFAANLTAGTVNNNAGQFSTVTTTMSRPSGNQNIEQVQLKFPPGLSGLLTGVKLCGEAEANAGTCGPQSLIGETIVSVGVGGEPYTVTGGKVYLTGPYRGAPFGLSIVNPAKAGPFNLGQVIVRGKVEVDQKTAALTVTTNGAGEGFAIPHILDGIPLQIQHVNVTINRPGFTFNPTNCEHLQVTGTIASGEGASAPVSESFQVANCERLAFKPTFKVSTNGKTSRRSGAALKVKLAYPKASFGSQANIASVKVALPKQLPSRLPTLQKACPHQTFQADPAACPSASRVGHAKATTPLLPVALEGPAYFVSYGGAKFPELVIVLQGYGVTVQLHGETFIDGKTNVTTSTFRTIPDVPVNTFELTLPQGEYSALAANTNLCQVKGGLKMPTLINAQNGKVFKQSTQIAISGCPKAHKKIKKKSKKGQRSRR